MPPSRIPDIRDPKWLLPTANKIASAVKRPPSMDYEDSVQNAVVIILERSHRYETRYGNGLKCSFTAWIIVEARWHLSNLYKREFNWCARRFTEGAGNQRPVGEWDTEFAHSPFADRFDADYYDYYASVEASDLLDHLAGPLHENGRIVFECMKQDMPVDVIVEATGLGKPNVMYHRKIIFTALEVGAKKWLLARRREEAEDARVT